MRSETLAYTLRLAGGCAQLVQRGAGGNAGRVGPGREHPVSGEWVHGPSRRGLVLSAGSRREMRRQLSELPWHRVERLALVSLTYPGDWRRWVPDAGVFEAHRRAAAKRWERRWGEPLMGVWVKEFQGRGAPHLHWYVGLPGAMTGEEYRALRVRSVAAKRREAEVGVYRARSEQRWGRWPWEYVRWLRTAWAEVVTGNTTRRHHGHGVDVRVSFWTDEQEAEFDRDKVGEYFWRESGKVAQKQVPDGFGAVGRWWGAWGRGGGFVPEVLEVSVDARVGWELSRVMAQRLRERMEGAGL